MEGRYSKGSSKKNITGKTKNSEGGMKIDKSVKRRKESITLEEKKRSR